MTITQHIRNKLHLQAATTHWISDNTLFLLLAGVVTLIHLLANGQYGFHRDELDILMNARQLDWGYIAYPPLTPFIARLGLELFGNSLQGLRLFPALGQGVAVVLVGLMARDMGGGRAAQWMAIIAAAISPVALTAGTLIQYMSFDYLWWLLLAFFLVHLLAMDDHRWWLGIGAAIGLGMMTKYTIAFFVAGLIAATLFTPIRRHLRTIWPWAGAAVALLIFLPNFIWQIQHQFISLDFLSAIHTRDIAWGRTDSFLPDQLYVASNPFLIPLWVAGLGFCLLHQRGKRFRALVWAFLVTVVLLYFARGRGYYTGPAYAMLLTAGAVWWEGWLAERTANARRVGLIISWTLLVVGSLVGLILIKPIAPVNSPLWEITSQVNGEVVEMIGWPDLAAQVAQIYAEIPADEKPFTVVLAGNYGEAGALDLYRQDLDLPRVISGSNSLWHRGYGSPEPETVIVVGFERNYALRFFASCQTAGRVTNQYGVQNEETLHHIGLYVCRQPRLPWAKLWQEMQWFQ